MASFMVTELDKILSGNKLYHFWAEAQGFGKLCLHHQRNDVICHLPDGGRGGIVLNKLHLY